VHEVHREADAVQATVGVPLIDIAAATAEAVKRTPSRRPALLAARYTMEQDFYWLPAARSPQHRASVPDEAGRSLVHRIIYAELSRGVMALT
jgi:aspartate racemase